MSFTSLYEFATTSLVGIVSSLSDFLVALLVTPFPVLLSNLSKTEGLAGFVSSALSELSDYIADIAMFNAPLLVILLSTFLLFYVVIAVARWLVP